MDEKLKAQAQRMRTRVIYGTALSTETTAFIEGLEAEIQNAINLEYRNAQEGFKNAEFLRKAFESEIAALRAEVERLNKEVSAGKFIYSQYRAEARKQFEGYESEIAEITKVSNEATVSMLNAIHKRANERDAALAEASNLKAIAQGVTHHETCWKSSEGYKHFLELREAVREHISDGLHVGPRSRRLREALWNVDALWNTKDKQ
jgi:hypothetical protein